jgi:hypothetical protein
MKNLVRASLILACLVATPSISHASNIIVNGGFETPDCDIAATCSSGTWGLFGPILGWTSSGSPIEIGEVINYGISGQEGDQVLELDSTGNATVEQVVAGSGTFTLSFLYADRLGGAQDSFDILWNGMVIDSVLAPLNGGAGAMQLYTTMLIAVAGPNTLAFRGTGASDSFGALIDDVKLESVPDGGVTALLLGMGLVALRRVRRIVA